MKLRETGKITFVVVVSSIMQGGEKMTAELI